VNSDLDANAAEVLSGGAHEAVLVGNSNDQFVASLKINEIHEFLMKTDIKRRS
jgi:hypothetical protein